MKKFIIILSSIIAILIAAMVGIYFMLNTIILEGVKTIGPTIIHTKVYLDKVDISIFSGKGILYNFALSNPKDSKLPYLFKVKKFYIDVQPASILKNEIIINKILIESPYISYEIQGATSNIQNFQQKIYKKNTFQEKISNTENRKNKTTGGDKDQKSVFIKNFIIKNAKVEIYIPKLQQKRIVVIDKIHLTNLGGKNQTPTQVIEKITNEIIKKILPNLGLTFKNLGELKEIKKGIESKLKKQGIKQNQLDKLKQELQNLQLN